MGFDIGDFVNTCIDAILDSSTVLYIASNPIFTAIAITLVLCFIILIVFRDADTEESLPVMTMRAGFWMFIAITGILLIHNKVLSVNTIEKKKATAYTNLMQPQLHLSKDVVPVPSRDI